jgi:SRSO17 transposase
MGRTVTPHLDAEAIERLYGYALEFRPLFGRSDRYKQGRVYLHGLLLDGERKSIEPLSRRVPGGNEQNLQQFINQSPWDPTPILAAYRARMAAAFATDDGVIVIDDTGFPKQGKYSVGVARQYSGTLGEAGELPSSDLAALRERTWRLPAGAAAVPAGSLDERSRAAGAGAGPARRARVQDQMADRARSAGRDPG